MVPEVAGMPVFDRSMLRRVEERLRRKDPAVLHIVGARDLWSATAFDVEGLKNSVRIIDTEGSHLTRIQTLPEDLRQRVLLSNSVISFIHYADKFTEYLAHKFPTPV